MTVCFALLITYVFQTYNIYIDHVLGGPNKSRMLPVIFTIPGSSKWPHSGPQATCFGCDLFNSSWSAVPPLLGTSSVLECGLHLGTWEELVWGFGFSQVSVVLGNRDLT